MKSSFRRLTPRYVLNQLDGHITPRYVLNRIKNILYQRRHPYNPWLTKDAINIIEQIIHKSDVGIEFGSGRSTTWFLKRLRHLISVESNESWYKIVENKCKREIKEGKLSYLFKTSEEEYINFINEIETESIDFCLIDGAFRDTCAINMLDKIKKNGVLVIDNINWYIPCQTYAPFSANKDFNNQLWRNFLKKTISWRYIHTTNGVWDTGIWIK